MRLDKLIVANEKDAERSNANNIAEFNKAKNVIIIYTAIAFLIIILLAYILTNNIIYPLNKIKDLALRLSRDDLSGTVSITRKDEFGQTALALNSAQENIKELIKEIMSNSSDMSAASEELSATVEEITAKIEIIDSSTEY